LLCERVSGPFAWQELICFANDTSISETWTIDLERVDGWTKDHAAFSLGNTASSVTIANLRPAL